MKDKEMTMQREPLTIEKLIEFPELGCISESEAQKVIETLKRFSKLTVKFYKEWKERRQAGNAVKAA